jgi:hypothetical protein
VGSEPAAGEAIARPGDGDASERATDPERSPRACLVPPQ